jgi:diguanylate cyclase (GGDEF)-like protein
MGDRLSEKNKIYLSYFILSLIPLIIHLTPNLKFLALIPEGYFDIIKFMPYLVFIGIGFLGLKLNQTRILFASLLFLLAYHSLSDPNLLMKLGIGKVRSRQIFASSLPLCFSFLFMVKEFPLLNFRSLMRLLFGLSPLFIFVILFVFSPKVFVSIMEFQIVSSHTQTVPQISYLSFLIFIFLNIIRNDSKISLFTTGLTFSLISFYTAAHIGLIASLKFYQLLPSNVVCFTSITIILIHAIYKMYWGRVYIDELTNIPNRRALDERLESLTGHYTIAIMDIDHFKNFNDTYGHSQGDSVLQMVADTLQRELGDRVYRYGGEEFCAVFPKLLPNEGLKLAEKARMALAQREFYIRSSEGTERQIKNRGQGPKGDKVQVTMSLGLATPADETQTPSDVIVDADKALYRAKDSGRNCSKVFEYT